MSRRGIEVVSKQDVHWFEDTDTQWHDIVVTEATISVVRNYMATSWTVFAAAVGDALAYERVFPDKPESGAPTA